MPILILVAALCLALGGAGAGAFLGLSVWGCLGLGALAGSLGTGVFVAVVMAHALRQDRAEQPWQDRRKAPVPDRRKAPAQVRLWQERRKGPRQDRRATPEFLMGR